MNAGTGNLSLAKNLISVKVINNKTHEKLEIKKKDINFEYRYSSFQKNDLIIISAKLHFEPNGNLDKLIDDMGLKGFKIGGAEISTIHSNFIINTSSASSKDIYELITVIQQKVLQKKGIYLQPEVRMIGFDYPN